MAVYGLYALFAAALAGLIRLGVLYPARRRRLWSVGLLVAAGAAAFLWSVSQPGQLLSDFKKAYYPAGRLIWESPVGMYRDVGLTFVNLPVVATLFSPLAALSRRLAGLLYLVLSGVSVVASGAGLMSLSRAAGWRKAAVAALILLNGPLYNSLREGNTTHLVLLALVGAAWGLEAGRQRGAGVLMAAGALIKPPLLVLVGPLLCRRCWRVVLAWALTLLGVVGLSFALFGGEPHRTWWQFCVVPYARYPLGAFNVQSVDGFLVHLLTRGEHLMSWFPVTDVGPSFYLAKAVLLAALLGATAVVFLRTVPPKTATETLGELSIALVLALLISPVSWTHYYLLLLIPMALVLGGRLALPAGRGWTVLFWLSALLVSLPVLLMSPEASLFHRLFVSHYFIGGVALFCVLLVACRVPR